MLTDVSKKYSTQHSYHAFHCALKLIESFSFRIIFSSWTIGVIFFSLIHCCWESSSYAALIELSLWLFMALCYSDLGISWTCWVVYTIDAIRSGTCLDFLLLYMNKVTDVSASNIWNSFAAKRFKFVFVIRRKSIIIKHRYELRFLKLTS